MGMFDSLYDGDGNEWQTKALACILDRYEIGDRMPPFTYQMEVIGGPNFGPPVWSFATIRDGVLASLPDERDEQLPLLTYSGDWRYQEEN